MTRLPLAATKILAPASRGEDFSRQLGNSWFVPRQYRPTKREPGLRSPVKLDTISGRKRSPGNAGPNTDRDRLRRGAPYRVDPCAGGTSLTGECSMPPPFDQSRIAATVSPTTINCDEERTNRNGGFDLRAGPTLLSAPPISIRRQPLKTNGTSNATEITGGAEQSPTVTDTNDRRESPPSCLRHTQSGGRRRHNRTQRAETTASGSAWVGGAGRCRNTATSGRSLKD